MNQPSGARWSGKLKQQALGRATTERKLASVRHLFIKSDRDFAVIQQKTFGF
jgi:hypothetical protein